jgi:hypothetical protein
LKGLRVYTRWPRVVGIALIKTQPKKNPTTTLVSLLVPSSETRVMRTMKGEFLKCGMERGKWQVQVVH